MQTTGVDPKDVGRHVVDRRSQLLHQLDHREHVPDLRDVFEGDRLIGKLTLAKSGIRQSFVTENVLVPPSGMTMTLVDGPFQSLEGGWLFEPLGADGVKVSLKLAFEFKSKLLDQTFGRVFSVAADTMVDAFSGEIAKRYG